MSLQEKCFKKGDIVCHVAYKRYGKIEEDISNEYAEAYRVKSGSHVFEASAGLLVSARIVNRVVELNTQFDVITGKYTITKTIHELVDDTEYDCYLTTLDGHHINNVCMGKHATNTYDHAITVHSFCYLTDEHEHIMEIRGIVQEWVKKRTDEVSKLLKSFKAAANASYVMRYDV